MLVKEYLKIILTAHKTMPTEIFLPLRLPSGTCGMWKFVWFAKDEPSQKQPT
jgi:hypothetical protein